MFDLIFKFFSFVSRTEIFNQAGEKFLLRMLNHKIFKIINKNDQTKYIIFSIGS